MALSSTSFRLIALFLCVSFVYECEANYTYNYWKSSDTQASAFDDTVYGIAVDSSKYTYITGATGGSLYGTWNDTTTVPRTSDMIVAKFVSGTNNNTVIKVWARQISSVLFDGGYAVSLSLDETKLYVAGTYSNSPIILELDSATGASLRNYTYSASNVSSLYPRYSDVTLCGTGFICAVGYYPTPTNSWDTFAQKLSVSGSSITATWTTVNSTSAIEQFNSVAFQSTSNRLFVGGKIVVNTTTQQELWLQELNYNSGAVMFEKVWGSPPRCNPFGDDSIVSIAVGVNHLYYLGRAASDLDSNGNLNGSCSPDGLSSATLVGSIPLSNLNSQQWAFDVSQLGPEYGCFIDPNAMKLGADKQLFIVGNSNCDVLYGTTNPGFNAGYSNYFYDWYLMVLNSSDATVTNFTYTGTTSGFNPAFVDDYSYAIDVNTQQGIIATSDSFGGTNDFNVFNIFNAPDPSPSPSPSATPSITPSTSPSRSPSPSASPSRPPSPSVTPSISVSPSFGSTPSNSANSSVNPSSSPSTGGNSNKKDNNLPIIVGVVLGAAVLCLVGVILFVVTKRKRDNEKRRKRGSQIGPDPESRGQSSNSVRLSVLEGINRNSALLSDNWNIDYKQIEIGAEIGRGAYGTVFRGKWRGSTVAVKQLNLEKTDQRAIEDFVKEASAVKRLRNHRNVCQIFGVCTDPEHPICIVMEYMEDGNLQNLVYKGKVHLDVDAILTMAKHTASGMSHLHSENILHCDLACRNLLVSIGKGNKYLVKISDFGMARVVENEKIYNASSEAQFPVRWSAPEVLSAGTVSRKSDVWSFGITVWEMIEGVKPYYELASNKEVIEYVVVNGYRLPRPKKVEIPPTLWEIMNQCWSPNPADRPEFEEILKKLSNLKKVLKAKAQGHDVTVTGSQPKPTGEIKPGGENYLTISDFKKGGTEASVSSAEEYNTAPKKNLDNNNNRPPKIIEDEDTYNKVNVKLTAQDVSGEDDYKSVNLLKTDSQGMRVPNTVAQPNDEDTYNKINFKNEFAVQNTNNADESDYLQINKPIFGGPANPPPAKNTPVPPPRHVEESDYTARVNVSNEFASSSQSSNADDYSTVRLNVSPQARQTQQQQDDDNYSKVVLKQNASNGNDESDYNVINFGNNNNSNQRKQSNVQDLYLNNKK